MEERCLHRVWVLSHKRRNAEPLSFRALPILHNLFDKSHSAPGRLKNVWGRSILLIKVSQRHSLKYLQKVIVDGGNKAVSIEKKKVSKVRKIPLLSKTTKRRCLHISDLLKQLLDKQKKVQLFDIYLDETTDVSEEVQLICVVVLSIMKQKPLASCVVLTLEFAQLLKPYSPNWMSSLKNMGLIGWSIRQLLPTEQQPCNALLMELTEKLKIFPLTVFLAYNSLFSLFLGESFGHKPKFFEMTEKTEVTLVRMPFSVIKKWPKTFKLFWKNNRNVSMKINLGFNSLHH